VQQRRTAKADAKKAKLPAKRKRNAVPKSSVQEMQIQPVEAPLPPCPGRAPAVDVILGSERIKDDIEYYRIYNTDYSLDNKPIALSVTGRAPRESLRRRKRLYKNVDQEKI
jgi:hypothetical protein